MPETTKAMNKTAKTKQARKRFTVTAPNGKSTPANSLRDAKAICAYLRNGVISDQFGNTYPIA